METVIEAKMVRLTQTENAMTIRIRTSQDLFCSP
jgi:hypothetical protein